MSFLRWTQLFKFSIKLNILHYIAIVLNKQKYGKLVGAEYVTTHVCACVCVCIYINIYIYIYGTMEGKIC